MRERGRVGTEVGGVQGGPTWWGFGVGVRVFWRGLGCIGGWRACFGGVLCFYGWVVSCWSLVGYEFVV